MERSTVPRDRLVVCELGVQRSAVGRLVLGDLAGGSCKGTADGVVRGAWERIVTEGKEEVVAGAVERERGARRERG